MSDTLNILGLFAATGILFALPFIPTIIETLKNGNATPLAADQRSSFDAHFGPVAAEFAAQRSVSLDEGSTMVRQATAKDYIRVNLNCTFQYLHAPQIVFGSIDGNRAARNHCAETLDNRFAVSRSLVRGDFEIQKGMRFHGDVVATGKISVCSGATVAGSLKAHKDVVVEEGVAVLGSVISLGVIRIGAAARINGPAVAGRKIFIADGAVVGRVNGLTTVTAPHIQIESGCEVQGTVAATIRGEVVSTPIAPSPAPAVQQWWSSAT